MPSVFASLLTTFFFALSAVCGQRLSRLLGGITANFVRLLLAVTLLTALTFTLFPNSFHRETTGWLLLSGVIGFGLGDVALFLAYPHLGSRLTVLILMAAGTLFSGFGDWMWQGVAFRPVELAGIAVILCGLILALHRPGERLRFNRGIAFAVLAGLGQGGGALISRHVNAIASAHDFAIPGLSQACQRAWGGLVIGTLAWFLLNHALSRRPVIPEPPKKKKFLLFWLGGAAVFGPVAGVGCMQWALQSLPAAIVTAITATAPLLIMPLAWFSEKDRPSPRAIAGCLLAVAGLCTLGWLRR